jgi:hypothetical protein
LEDWIDTRSIGDQIPQRLPLLQETAGALENAPPDPFTLEAKVEICFVTWLLSQEGQITSSIEPTLRSSSSNGVPHSWQRNSKIGINFSLVIRSV